VSSFSRINTNRTEFDGRTRTILTDSTDSIISIFGSTGCADGFDLTLIEELSILEGMAKHARYPDPMPVGQGNRCRGLGCEGQLYGTSDEATCMRPERPRGTKQGVDAAQ